MSCFRQPGCFRCMSKINPTSKLHNLPQGRVIWKHDTPYCISHYCREETRRSRSRPHGSLRKGPGKVPAASLTGPEKGSLRIERFRKRQAPRLRSMEHRGILRYCDGRDRHRLPACRSRPELVDRGRGGRRPCIMRRVTPNPAMIVALLGCECGGVHRRVGLGLTRPLTDKPAGHVKVRVQGPCTAARQS